MCTLFCILLNRGFHVILMINYYFDEHGLWIYDVMMLIQGVSPMPRQGLLTGSNAAMPSPKWESRPFWYIKMVFRGLCISVGKIECFVCSGQVQLSVPCCKRPPCWDVGSFRPWCVESSNKVPSRQLEAVLLCEYS